MESTMTNETAIEDEVIILLSKRKNLLALIGSLAFIALGSWIFVEAGRGQINFADDSFRIRLAQIAGILAIAFFGMTTIWTARQLFNSNPGLILNANGITDYSNATSPGLIPWSDIIGFGQYKIQRQKSIIVLLKNPETYIQKGNAVQQKLTRINFNMTGSPVAIGSVSLQITFDELVELCETFYQKYGSRR